MDLTSKDNKQCITCKSALYGEYCHNCGEKVISDKDYTFKKILEQAFDSITHIDSKLFKTFLYLLFKPGRLSMEYIRGYRKPFMKPFQLFVVTNMLFFILLSSADIFRKPSSWWFSQPADGIYNVKAKVAQLVASEKSTLKEISIHYDHQSNVLAKGFVIFFIPLIGLIMVLLHIRKKYPFGRHFIYSIHFFSFLLLLIALWTELLRILPIHFNRLLWGLPIVLVTILYLIISIQKFYNDKWLVSIIKSLVAFIFLIDLVLFYRAGISILALNLI